MVAPFPQTYLFIVFEHQKLLLLFQNKNDSPPPPTHDLRFHETVSITLPSPLLLHHTFTVQIDDLMTTIIGLSNIVILCHFYCWV